MSVPSTKRGRTVGRGRSPRRVLVAVSMTVALVALVACSSSSNTSATPKPLTEDQASVLSQVLFKNYDSKGSTFTLAAPVRPGLTLRLAGEVDWVAHVGHAQVTWEGNPAPGRVEEVFWRDTDVVERLPGLADELTKAGKPAGTWMARPPDTKNNGLDRALELVVKLASQQRDNPVLLRQQAGTGWLRKDRTQGRAVDVYAYTDKIRHWVATDDGRLLRLEAEIGGFTQATIVDITSVGEQKILGPKRVDVVPIASANDIYERLNPPPR